MGSFTSHFSYIILKYRVMINKIQTTRRTTLRICDSVVLESGVTCPVIHGQCSQVDFISQNGYRYKNGFWERVLNNPIVMESIENRDVLGMIEHPEDDDDFLKTPYETASHVVLKAWCDSGNPYAQFGLLNNPKGNSLKALVDIGHKPGVSTRGLGTFITDSTSQYVDDSNYAFITWDIVKSPNFADLKMEKVTDSLRKTPLFQEFTEMYHLRDSVDESYNKEKLLVDMEKVQQTLVTIQNFLKLKS